MISLSYKSKQYLLATLKVLILAITFGYIYLKLTDAESLPLGEFLNTFNHQALGSLPLVFIFFGMATLNWFFEILKWKTVVSIIENISFYTALKQSLSSLTVSLATPNRIGDYGAKAYFYKAKKRKQILVLNFFSNSVQMSITTLFGLGGLIYLSLKYNIPISGVNVILIILVVLLFAFLAYLFKERELILKGLSLSKVYSYVKNLDSGIKIHTFLYSVIRYFIFSTLFFLILNFFGCELLFLEAMPIIFGMYLLVSLIPTVFIFDVVVRGGVGVWLFSLAGVPELITLCAVLAMWLLNFVFPAILGSFYLIKHPTE